MADEGFRGRTVPVTGGSRGIGRATRLRLAGTGVRIAINTVGDEAALGTPAGDPDPGWMLRSVGDRPGPVASAGDHSGMSFDIPNEMMRVHVKGTFHAVRLARDGMLARDRLRHRQGGHRR